MMCVLGLSYVCNSLCLSCPYTNSEIRSDYGDRPFMREDTFKIIADQCGTYVRGFAFGRGEPMLHPQAVELIGICQRGKSCCWINNKRFKVYRGK